MRITATLLRSFRKATPGNIYIGKHRKWPKVTEEAFENKIKRLKIEEENMFLLRHPYLTLDQSWGHAIELGKNQKFEREKYLELQNKKAKPDVTLEERYTHLRNTDVWD